MSLFPDKNDKIERPLNLAIKYLGYRPRTVYEMKQYIEKKGFEKDIGESIIKILLDRKYLDDAAFTSLFIKSKIKYKPKSTFAIGYELKKKGVCPSVIETAISQYDDRDLAVKAAEQKIKIWQNLDDDNFKKKMMNFLRYRGFNYDIAISTLNHFMESKDKR